MSPLPASSIPRLPPLLVSLTLIIPDLACKPSKTTEHSHSVLIVTYNHLQLLTTTRTPIIQKLREPTGLEKCKTKHQSVLMERKQETNGTAEPSSRESKSAAVGGDTASCSYGVSSHKITLSTNEALGIYGDKKCLHTSDIKCNGENAFAAAHL